MQSMASGSSSASDIDMETDYHSPDDPSDIDIDDSEPEEPTPAPAKVAKGKATATTSKSKPRKLSRPPSPIFEEDIKPAKKKAQPKRPTRSTSNTLAGLEDELNGLNIQGRDSTTVIPNKAARKAAISHAGPGVEYIPRPGEVDTVKKKKRYVHNSLLCSTTHFPCRQLGKK